MVVSGPLLVWCTLTPAAAAAAAVPVEAAGGLSSGWGLLSLAANSGARAVRVAEGEPQRTQIPATIIE